ncbi:MAG: GspE/PulE family protein [Deferribacteraceae bacterium]|jgi:type IV pilus assembly protein PilB|nr:GspE/PulE family protein [Deferribacteraceae bacterium]
MERLPLGKLLLNFGYVTEEQIAVAIDIQGVRKKLLGELLVEHSFVSPQEIAVAISKQSGLPFIDVSEYHSSKEALNMLNRNIAKQLSVLPLNIQGDVFSVAMSDPFDINSVDILKRRSGMEINIFVSDRETILKRAEMLYYLLENPINATIKLQIEQVCVTGAISDIPGFINNIVNNALTERATDIHISPEERVTHIFYRIDGIMRHYYACPKSIHASLISRIKIISNMDISEQRMPQDGSFAHTFFDELFDMRVSTLPTVFGESLVLRILSKNLSLFNLEALGFREDILKQIIKQFERPQGIVLVTGPTGCGKTTTLYAGLRRINSLQRRVLSVEDPVEYKFPFIMQTQVNEKSGYNFNTAMRAFFRQDPDVILLGEMRDEHTAEMAFRASITGHLVLSTMHTNDAVSSIPRLADLNVKGYFVASALSAVIAQRLLRKVCAFCAKDLDVTMDYLLKLGFRKSLLDKLAVVSDSKITLSYGEGCEYCHGTGYFGRTVISELLVMDEELNDMIVRGHTPLALTQAAVSKGMVSMIEDGLIKSLIRVTNPEEVKRVVM